MSDYLNDIEEVDDDLEGFKEYNSEEQFDPDLFYIDDDSIGISVKSRHDDYEISEDLMYDDYSQYLEYFNRDTSDQYDE